MISINYIPVAMSPTNNQGTKIIKRTFGRARLREEKEMMQMP